MTPLPASTIHDWHAHIYFDRHTAPAAQALRVAILRAFDDLELGRFHQRPVGPHPMWSFQVAFGPNLFPTLVPWLALNRGALIVLVHPNSGQALEDHRDRALWLGAGLPLALDVLH